MKTEEHDGSLNEKRNSANIPRTGVHNALRNTAGKKHNTHNRCLFAA
jgi:hypothetical protein